MSPDLSHLSPERRAVVEAIWASLEPIGAKELADLVPSSEGSIRQMLTPLTNEGLIKRVRRGRYWRPDSQTDEQTKTTHQVKGPDGLRANAEFVELGPDTVWVPVYPVHLGAGHSGDVTLEEIEPEGAFPVPGAFARRLGINGTKRPFAVTVRGDSMSADFDDGAIVFGYRVEEADVEGIYALYSHGDLLVKHVRRTRDGGYELISSNKVYDPIPVRSEDVYIIGRVVGALTSI